MGNNILVSLKNGEHNSSSLEQVFHWHHHNPLEGLWLVSKGPWSSGDTLDQGERSTGTLQCYLKNLLIKYMCTHENHLPILCGIFPPPIWSCHTNRGSSFKKEKLSKSVCQIILLFWCYFVHF